MVTGINDVILRPVFFLQIDDQPTHLKIVFHILNWGLELSASKDYIALLSVLISGEPRTRLYVHWCKKL